MSNTTISFLLQVIPYLEVFIATIPAQNVIIQGDDPVIELKFLLADSTQIALYNQIAPIIHWSFVGDLFPVQFIPSGIGSVPFAGEKFRAIGGVVFPKLLAWQSRVLFACL
jgi:hypothetical protein